MQTGQLDRAQETLQQAQQLNPSFRNQAALGVVYDLNGSHAQAQALYREGLKQDASNVDLRNNMGLSMLLQGNSEGAIAVLQSIVADPKATAQHRANLALAYGLTGKENAARRLLQLDLAPTEVDRNIELYKSMAQLYGRPLREAVLTGDLDSANQGSAEEYGYSNYKKQQ
jgi:Flp pilus assembly protein TadD